MRIQPRILIFLDRLLDYRRCVCLIIVNHILASDALREALPQRMFDLTFSLPFKPDRRVVASEHV